LSFFKHSGTLEDGNLFVLDAGVDYIYYASDITTTFPVNGRFSEKQAYYYQLAYAISRLCISSYKPGVTFKEVVQKARDLIRSKSLGPEDPLFRVAVNWDGYNHLVGMATHDLRGAIKGPDDILVP